MVDFLFFVGWANGSIVNPTVGRIVMLGCQKDGSPTYGNRSHALRGNAADDAPASGDAGASKYGFPRGAWEPSGFEYACL